MQLGSNLSVSCSCSLGFHHRRCKNDTVHQFFGTTPLVLHDFSFETDGLAHSVIPSHPPSKPHARMLHRFRFIPPLLSVDEDGLTSLHYMTLSSKSRGTETQLSEHDFTLGVSLDACRSEMLEGSSTQVDLRHTHCTLSFHISTWNSTDI